MAFRDKLQKIKSVVSRPVLCRPSCRTIVRILVTLLHCKKFFLSVKYM